MVSLFCGRCGWMIPDDCTCRRTNRSDAIGAVRDVNRRHVEAVLRARMSDLVGKGWAA